MSPDRNGAPLFGRRQILLGGGTFLAGVIGVTVWSNTHSGNRSSSRPPPTTTPSPTTTSQTHETSIDAASPAQATNATE